MENLKLYCLIFELRGMVNSLSNLANYDDSYDIPGVDAIEGKMKEIIQEIEKKSA